MATKDILEPSLEVLGISPYKPKKGEEYMNGKMRAHFTNILTLLRKQIMEIEHLYQKPREEAIIKT